LASEIIYRGIWVATGDFDRCELRGASTLKVRGPSDGRIGRIRGGTGGGVGQSSLRGATPARIASREALERRSAQPPQLPPQLPPRGVPSQRHRKSEQRAAEEAAASADQEKALLKKNLAAAKRKKADRRRAEVWPLKHSPSKSSPPHLPSFP